MEFPESVTAGRILTEILRLQNLPLPLTLVRIAKVAASSWGTALPSIFQSQNPGMFLTKVFRECFLKYVFQLCVSTWIPLRMMVL